MDFNYFGSGFQFAYGAYRGLGEEIQWVRNDERNETDIESNSTDI